MANAHTRSQDPSIIDPAGEADFASAPAPGLLRFLLIGIFFGIVLTKSEVISWFRIQEMFRFQSFHMYGIIGSGVLTAMLLVKLMEIRHTRTTYGSQITVEHKPLTRGAYRYWIGGTIFGLGWALTGACPGPIYALMGTGLWVMGITFLSALLGAWVYAWLQPHLPH
jgi:uncharacterized membrane protein YedE/YeeE